MDADNNTPSAESKNLIATRSNYEHQCFNHRTDRITRLSPSRLDPSSDLNRVQSRSHAAPRLLIHPLSDIH